MIDFSVGSVVSFTSPQKVKQVIHCPWLALSLSGIKYMRAYHADGSLIAEMEGNQPFFGFAIPGTKIEGEYGKDRENWIIKFSQLPIRLSGLEPPLELKYGEDWIPLQMMKRVPNEHFPKWQSEMRKLRELSFNPIPRNRLKAQLSVLSIFDFFLSDTLAGVDETPAGRLKRLIDGDNEFEKTIAQHSRKCSYSRDHLRIQFQKQFQISPQEYRTQKRMACVMDYISNSELTVDEIAIETGFQHTSHLCKIFKKYFGRTPGETIKQFRYR